jgi:signal transduction histidine kinase
VVLSLSLVSRLTNFASAADPPVDEARDDLSTYRLAKVPPNAKEGLGTWIWTDKTFDRQTCRLWKEFDIPAGTKVVSAQMRMTVDNGYQFFLDGRELGQGADWRALTEYDLTLLLAPGHHVLAVNAFNDFFEAGLIMDLPIELSNGRISDIKSDQSWRVVPNDERGWEKRKHPRAEWPPATAITGTNCASQWNDHRWPYDFISVPRFYPLDIPFWQTGWFHLMLVSACGLIFLGCIALLVQLALQSKEQRLLNLERARIARDIHDDFGTRLTRLILAGEMAQNELADNTKACRHFSRISDGLRDALGAMDEVLWAVNPRRDTVRDFVTFICEYAQSFLQPTSIQCLLEVEPDMPDLDFDLPLRRSLLLAVKEAINNAAKHSGCGKLLLQIHRREPGLAVMVEDDGKGFDPAQISRERNGLGNMIQRMNEVGGQCRIVSEPGNGCRVEFSIPLTRQHSWFGWLTRSWRGRLENENKITGAKAAAGVATESTLKT